MEMTDKTVNERRVHAKFNEAELEELLVNAVAAQSGIKLDRNTKIEVFISSEFVSNCAFPKSYAEVTLVNEVVK